MIAKNGLDESKLQELLSKYWEIGFSEGKTGVLRGNEANEVLFAIIEDFDDLKAKNKELDEEWQEQFNNLTDRFLKEESKNKELHSALVECTRFLDSYRLASGVTNQERAVVKHCESLIAKYKV